MPPCDPSLGLCTFGLVLVLGPLSLSSLCWVLCFNQVYEGFINSSLSLSLSLSFFLSLDKELYHMNSSYIKERKKERKENLIISNLWQNRMHRNFWTRLADTASEEDWVQLWTNEPQSFWQMNTMLPLATMVASGLGFVCLFVWLIVCLGFLPILSGRWTGDHPLTRGLSQIWLHVGGLVKRGSNTRIPIEHERPNLKQIQGLRL